VQNAAFGSVIDGYMPTQVAGHTGGSDGSAARSGPGAAPRPVLAATPRLGLPGRPSAAA